jgi:signal transduction histidine kinase
MSIDQVCFKCKKIFKNLKSELDFETSDLMEMLENLKTSFKLGHSMEISEENVSITTQKIVQSICKTHKKLAINGVNKYTIQVKEFFPKNLCIQKTLFKRVVNNIISNSLKHT